MRTTAVSAALVGVLILGSVTHAGAQVFAPAQGKVENVEWKRDGTNFTVTYDLTSSDPTGVFKVALMASMDGMSFKPVAVTGDIGDEVSPGKGKKIVWQVAKDTDSQDYDLFRFSVLAVSGKLKEVPSPAQVVEKPPAVAPPVTAPPVAAPVVETPPVVTAPAEKPPVEKLPSDLRGTWMGSYAGSATAELIVDRQTGISFSGRLLVAMKTGDAPTEISVEGAVMAQSIELREVAVLRTGKLGSWNLGSGSGGLDADGRGMRGTGRDRRTSYNWSFSRQASATDVPAAASVTASAPSTGAVDLRGEWTGIYAGFQAQLKVVERMDSKFIGTLNVTTRAGKPATVLDVEIVLSGNDIVIRESRVVMAGAVSSWNLASGTGTLDASGDRMSGNGRDSRSSFTWGLARVPGRPND
jgi:hypothetical protein